MDSPAASHQKMSGTFELSQNDINRAVSKKGILRLSLHHPKQGTSLRPCPKHTPTLPLSSSAATPDQQHPLLNVGEDAKISQVNAGEDDKMRQLNAGEDAIQALPSAPTPLSTKTKSADALQLVERALFIRSATITFCFVSLWTPMGIHIIRMANGRDDSNPLFDNVAYSLVILNCGVNPLIFILTDARTRATIKGIFSRRGN